MDYHSVARHIRVVALPLIILCGTVGNILFFLVLRRRGMNPDSPTSFLLQVLAMVDLLVLSMVLLPKFIGYAMGQELEEIADISCKLINFSNYTMTDLSCWILVLVTIERFIAIAAPSRFTRIFSTKIARLLVAIIVFTLIAINCVIPFMLRLKDGKCVPHPHFRYFWEVTFVWVDLILFGIVPLLTICIISIAIAIVLQSSGTGYRAREDSGEAGQFLIPAIAMSSVTKMLVVMDIMFLVAASPLTFFTVLLPGWREFPDANERAEAELIFAVCEILTFSIYMSKFYLCCLSGSRFRKELKNMFKNKFSVKDTAMVDSPPSSIVNRGQVTDYDRDDESRCDGQSEEAEEAV
ncbi:G-protein coupled receptor 183-like [Lineus longissimus]|uniref:G-protein coupled receptor 183-like n=1 Tax=Lineus longissimus TaxID=88925 RepID=UPI00315DC94A